MMRLGAAAQRLSALPSDASLAWGVRQAAAAAKLVLIGSGVPDAAAALAARLGGVPAAVAGELEEVATTHGRLLGTFRFLARRAHPAVATAACSASAVLERSFGDPVFDEAAALEARGIEDAFGVAFGRWRRRALAREPLGRCLARGAWDFKWPLGFAPLSATVDAAFAGTFDTLDSGARLAVVNLALGPALAGARRLPTNLLLSGVVSRGYLEAVEPLDSIADHEPLALRRLDLAVRRVSDSLASLREPPRRPGDRSSGNRAAAFAWVDEMGSVRAGALGRLLGVSKPGIGLILDSLDAADALRPRPHPSGRLWAVSPSFGERQRPRGAAMTD